MFLCYFFSDTKKTESSMFQAIIQMSVELRFKELKKKTTENGAVLLPDPDQMMVIWHLPRVKSV